VVSKRPICVGQAAPQSTARPPTTCLITGSWNSCLASLTSAYPASRLKTLCRNRPVSSLLLVFSRRDRRSTQYALDHKNRVHRPFPKIPENPHQNSVEIPRIRSVHGSQTDLLKAGWGRTHKMFHISPPATCYHADKYIKSHQASTFLLQKIGKCGVKMLDISLSH
jgi:hypothetical protein